MRLHVGVGGAEQLLGAVDRQGFGDVDELAAAVIALAGIAFGILVGQHRALRLEHPRTRVILGSDEFDVILLTGAFARNSLRKFWIEAGNGHLGAEHEVISEDSR